jgi:hypothetical protein
MRAPPTRRTRFTELGWTKPFEGAFILVFTDTAGALFSPRVPQTFNPSHTIARKGLLLKLFLTNVIGFTNNHL